MLPPVMTFLAASTTVVERLSNIPSSVWMRLGVAILALVALVIVLRRVAKMNKVVLGVIVFLVVTIIGFNWIYERNEPSWATPVVEKLAMFLPTKGTATMK